jgi:catechol 2,3-dioxygenase-like lactoylglutathione lyase family enzyme
MNTSPKITGSRFVLAVKDLKKSAEYYQNQLGFKTLWAGEGWHFLDREKFVVMLGECANEPSAFETGDHSYFAYIDVENIDELYLEYSSKEVEIRSKPEDKPWGQREFSIRTIDGHRIMFGQQTITNNDL